MHDVPAADILADFDALLSATEDLVDDADRDPIAAIRWTPPQWDFLGLDAARKLLRAGNQVGKTWVGLAEVILRCIGRHPRLPVRRPPIEAWIVCTSWQQSVAIMGKFHDLCPATYVDERQSSRYSRKNGYGKENPTVVFRPEWGGSIVRFKTTMQGAEAVASGTIDLVLVDEPPTEEVFRELMQRVKRRGGTILITLTPINHPCGWLHDMVEDGVVHEVHAKLTPPNLVPVGMRHPLRASDGARMDADWIAEQRRITPPSYAPVVLDGEWETRPEGIFFVCFDRAKHVSDRMRLDPERGPIRWCLGIDYAAADREYGQCAPLVQVQQTKDERGRTHDAVLVVDEVVLPGVASTTEFVRAVLGMLDRHGLRWRDLQHVHGDNPVASRWIEKSNIQTRNILAKELGISKDAVRPVILNAKEGRASSGMLDTGCRYLYERIATGDLMVHPRCELMIRALETWDYTRDHPAKDRVDALRYALKPYIFPSGRSAAVTVRVA